MGRFRKTIEEIVQDYDDSKIKTDTVQFYKSAKNILEHKIEDADKLQKRLNKIEEKKTEEEILISSIEKRIGKVVKKHPVRTRFSRIPLVGRVPEIIGSFGNLPVIRRIPIVKELGEVGKYQRKYRSLRKQLALAKKRKKMLKNNAEDLKPVLEKYTRDAELNKRSVKKCEKTLRRTYNIEKSNIEISKLYEEKKALLKKAYDKNSMAYIKNYVEAIRRGDNPEKLPDDIASSKEMIKKLNKALADKERGKAVSELKVEDQFVSKPLQENNHRNSIPQGTFARMGLDIKRAYTNITLNIDGKRVELSPEETLAYIGMLENYSSEKDVLKIIKDGQIKLEEKEELGWKHLKQMVDIMKSPTKKIEYEKLSDYGKKVYNVASVYIQNEENDIQIQQSREPASQPTRS